MNLIEIWIEGYVAQGNSAGASLLGSFTAKNFDDAIALYAALGHERLDNDGKKNDRGFYTIWGCRLFDNEADARKAFG